MAKVTAILLSYKRKPNMPRAIRSLREQTVPIDIWVVNNNGHEGFGADRLIAIPWNAGEMIRYALCGRPRTEYVMFQDDDLVIQDDTFVEDAIDILEDRVPGFTVGISGRNINWEGDGGRCGHYWPEAPKERGAALCKGQLQVFRRETARKAHIPDCLYSSDILWGLDMSWGAPVHWVSGELASRVKHIEQHGVGLEHRPGHYQERSDTVQRWIENHNIQPYWWNGGERPGKRGYGFYEGAMPYGV